jgi:hypothetical protein
MPFTVIFLPTDASPPSAQVQADMREIVGSEAGPVRADGTVRSAGQPGFVLSGDDIHLRRLSFLTCKVIFDIARQTNSVVITGGRGAPYLMMSGSSGKLPEDDAVPAVTPVMVPDAKALCVRLRPRLRHWNADIARDQSAGLLDADEQFISPPEGPGESPRIQNDQSGIAAKCESIIREQASKLGWTLQRYVVTKDAKWGVVLRADTATHDDPPYVTREMCWSRTGRLTDLEVSSHPLMVFDPRQSLAPLPEK